MSTIEALPQPSVLLAFRAKNVRSFRDELRFSMLATSIAEPDAVREVPWREGGQTIGVLPVAGIFGANASGKSNLLRALADMRNYVLHSFRHGSPTGGIPTWPFLLDPAVAAEPSTYEADLVLDGVRHLYGFTIDKDRVLEEWAFRYPKGRAALLFNREGDHLEFGAAARAKSRATAELLRPNALFLSTAASTNHPLLLPLYGWFQRNLVLAEVASRPLRQAFTTELLENEETREQVLELLRAADLGITGARTKELDPEMRERLQRAVRILQGEDGDEGEAIEFENSEVRLTHQGSAGEIELSGPDESMGTLVWFGLVGPVLDALAKGFVLLADELDASLHPALVDQLIRLFQSPETNPNRAQLIFNSHDVNVLGDSSERTLGRDQLWFTEKLVDGGTRLYPLSDMNPRKDEAIRRRYLAGRYGGTPILSHHQFEDAAARISAGTKT